jgi:DNA-binding MarR family transcriptional regulator
MEEDTAALAACLERLVGMARRLSHSAAPSADLSPTTAATLGQLLTAGPCRLSDLATSQAVTQPAMTQLVSRLERDGLACRRSCATDARVVLVSITDAGREMLLRRQHARTARLGHLLERLPAPERARLAAAVPSLNHLADLESVGSSPR